MILDVLLSFWLHLDLYLDFLFGFNFLLLFLVFGLWDFYLLRLFLLILCLLWLFFW